MKRFVFLLLALSAGNMSSVLAHETITTEGVIDAPVAKVWNAWTTTSGLKAWLAPHVEIDLRIDGLMRTNYDPKGSLGDSGTIENRVLAFDPERMLSIRVTTAPADFPFKARVGEMWTVVYFQPTPEGKTVLHIVGLGFADDAESEGMKAFFQRGNDYTLAQLQKRFEQ